MKEPDLETVFDWGDGDDPAKWSKLQVDRNTNELYWNNQRLVTTKRWSDYERTLAKVGLVVGGIAAAATVVAALFPVAVHFKWFGW